MTMKTKNRRLLIYDFETTGLDPVFNQPIEVSVRIIEGDKTEYYHAYIKMRNPEYQISRFITQLTGIDKALLDREGKDIDVVFSELYDLFSGEDVFVIGYNTSKFDNKFLAHNLSLIGKEMPSFKQFDCCFAFKAKILGLVRGDNESIDRFHARASGKMIKGVKFKLSDAVAYYKIPEIAKFHNARADVDYTYEIYLRQREEYLAWSAERIKDAQVQLINKN